MCKLVRFDEGDIGLVHSEPLNSLIFACETRCMFGCCGYSACEFTPEIMMNRFFSSPNTQKEYPDQNSLIQLLISQCHSLKHEFGSFGIIQQGYEHSDCSDAYWTGLGVDGVCDNIIYCLKVILVEQPIDPNYKGAEEDYDWHSTNDEDLNPIYGPSLAKLFYHCKKEIDIDEDSPDIAYGCYDLSYENIHSFVNKVIDTQTPKKPYIKRLKNELKDFKIKYKETGFYWDYYDTHVSKEELKGIFTSINLTLNRIIRNG